MYPKYAYETLFEGGDMKICIVTPYIYSNDFITFFSCKNSLGLAVINNILLEFDVRVKTMLWLCVKMML